MAHSEPATNGFELSLKSAPAEHEGLIDSPPKEHAIKPKRSFSFTRKDDVQEPDRRLKASWRQRALVDTWIPEIVAVTMSTVCLIVVVVVLRIFTGEAVPTFPYGVTLNAIIAVLATASRSMLIYAVAAAISQLKWCWYLQSRKLQDMQIFDDASRGPWGSLTLLILLRARPLASLGAAVTILALATDPFVQLLITYPTHAVPSPDLVAPDVVRATAFMESLPSNAFNNALEAGIWSKPQEFDQHPSCPSSKCSWNFHSVGWCSKCKDVGADTQVVNCDTRELFKNPDSANTTGCQLIIRDEQPYTLYNGLAESVPPSFPSNDTVPTAHIVNDAVWVLHSHDWPNLTRSDTNTTFWPNETSRSSTYLDVFDPVVTFAHVSVSWDQTYDASIPLRHKINMVEECILTLCDVEYQISTENGAANTKVVNRNFGSIETYNNTWWWSGGTVSCWQSNNRTEPEPPPEVLQAEKQIADSIFCPTTLANPCMPNCYSWIIAEQLVGEEYVRYYSPYEGGDEEPSGLSDHDDANYTSPAAQYIATHSLEEALAGVAASLSHHSRAVASLYSSAEDVPGLVFGTVTYVQTAWYWLIFPFILNVGGILFLFLAVYQSKRKGIRPWKASILPLLYHGLEPELLSTRPLSVDVSAMEKVAESTTVHLALSKGRSKAMLKQA